MLHTWTQSGTKPIINYPACTAEQSRGRILNLEQLTRIRKRLGLAGAFFCLVFFFGVVDSVLMQVLKEHYTVDILPGGMVKVNGPMPERIKEISELTYVSENKSLLVDIERIHTGYWLGGNLWNGRVEASMDIAPGSYRFMVRPVEFDQDEAFPIFTALVHASAAEMQKHSGSMINRNLGIMPWWLSAASLPIAVFLFWKVHGVSRQREINLLQTGKAEIVRIKKSGDKKEIAFGLGENQGVRQGTVMTLLNPSGEPIGSFKVALAFDNSSLAIVTQDCPVTPKCIVTRA